MQCQLIVRSSRCLFVPKPIIFILITTSIANMFINKSILVCIHLTINTVLKSNILRGSSALHPVQGSTYAALVASSLTPPTPRARIITMKKRMTLVWTADRIDLAPLAAKGRCISPPPAQAGFGQWHFRCLGVGNGCRHYAPFWKRKNGGSGWCDGWNREPLKGPSQKMYTDASWIICED